MYFEFFMRNYFEIFMSSTFNIVEVEGLISIEEDKIFITFQKITLSSFPNMSSVDIIVCLFLKLYYIVQMTRYPQAVSCCQCNLAIWTLYEETRYHSIFAQGSTALTQGASSRMQSRAGWGPDTPDMLTLVVKTKMDTLDNVKVVWGFILCVYLL